MKMQQNRTNRSNQTTAKVIDPANLDSVAPDTHIVINLPGGGTYSGAAWIAGEIYCAAEEAAEKERKERWMAPPEPVSCAYDEAMDAALWAADTEDELIKEKLLDDAAEKPVRFVYQLDWDGESSLWTSMQAELRRTKLPVRVQIMPHTSHHDVFTALDEVRRYVESNGLSGDFLDDEMVERENLLHEARHNRERKRARRLLGDFVTNLAPHDFVAVKNHWYALGPITGDDEIPF